MADTETRHRRWTGRQREAKKMNIRENEQIIAEIIDALPETIAKQGYVAKWATLGSNVKLIAHLM